MPEIDIDDLTIAQAKRLVALFAQSTTKAEFSAGCSEILIAPIPVIVCTDKRGVVFGWTNDTAGEKITLDRARMALSWSSDVGGVFGLAEKGPTKDCRISAVAPSITLSGITAVFSVDPAAVKSWEKAPVQGR